MRNHEIRKYRGNVMSAVTEGRSIVFGSLFHLEIVKSLSKGAG